MKRKHRTILFFGVCAAATLMIAAAIYVSERATFESTWSLVMKRLKRA